MRNTKNRKKILELLASSHQALSAQEIFNNLDGVDLATVYRNLNKFVEEGLIRELRINKGESIYEINEDGHEHTICSECGKIRHITINKNKIKKVLNIEDFDIDDIELTIKGRCK